MLLSLKPDVILIQEMMCSGEKAKEMFVPWIKNWSFCSINIKGHLGVLIIGWSSDCKALSSWSIISIKLNIKYINFSFTLVNVYGPYADRIPYWEDLKTAGAFNDPLIVVGGDMNFSLSLR
jgi:exonuclease III